MKRDEVARSSVGIVPLLLALTLSCDERDQHVTQEPDEAPVLAASIASAALTVRVAQGELAGKTIGATRAFLNIPYAKPPVGALRFAPARAADGWSGVREGLEYGASCPQPPNPLAMPGPQSEDCLSLNVFAPASGARLPVIVYIPGGGFVTGGSREYDVHKLSEQAQAVVVTLNYRLGPLALLSHPALDAERGGQPSGNDAIGDQQLALNWVKNNIGAFGGDPGNVTLMGVSAGSLSTCVHMVSPPSRALAQRFVLESGVCTGGLPLNTKEQAEAIAAEFAQAFCAGERDVIACLRSQPVEPLVAWGADRGLTGAGWIPVVNPADPILPEHPTKLIAAGHYNKGPVILGSNAREFGLFQSVGQAPKVASVAELNEVLEGMFGPLAPFVLWPYPAPTDRTANDLYVQLMTDLIIRCPTRAFARSTSEQGTRAYLYHFEEGLAYHVYELPYVLGVPSALFGAPTLVEPLRAFVQEGIANFVRTGNPNARGSAAWPVYTTATDRHVTLEEMPSVGRRLSRAQCDFWDLLMSLAQAF